MKRILSVLTVHLLLVCTIAAQTQIKTQTTPSDARTAGRKKAQSSRSKTQRDEQGRAPRRIWLTMSLSSLFDSNVDDEPQAVRSFGLVPGLGVHFQDNAESPSFEADYEVALHRYTNTEKYDRVSHNLSASYRLKLASKWQARTTGEVSIKGSSEDRDVNNQYVLEQQLQYRLSPSRRARLFVAYRVKRYPLEDIGKNAVDPYAGGRFEQKLKGERTVELMYRYDKNRSQDPKDRYVRSTYSANFNTPLSASRHDSLTLEARYSPRLYARQIKVDDARVPRRDRRWTFDALYQRPLSSDVNWGLNYRYETRNSNDPDKKFNSHLLGLTFAFKWWK